MTVLCVGEPLVVLTPAAGTVVDGGPLQVTIGGAEVNVAIHLSRLGMRAALASAVGTDPFGQLVLDRLMTEGVDVSGVLPDPDRPTGLYVKDPGDSSSRAYYYRAGSAAAAYDCATRPVVEGRRLVHVTGVQAAICPDPADPVRLAVRARGAGVLVSLDVNHRPRLWSSDPGSALLELARAADIVFVGLDEARGLWGVDKPEDVRTLLPAVAEVVVKDGPGVVVAWSGEDRVDSPAGNDPVVELVGAGDAFAAAYLHARLRGRDQLRACQDGHALAGHVIGSRSDNGERGAAVYDSLRA